MKKILVLAFLLVLNSCASSKVSSSDTINEKPRHIIISIHGERASETFTDFHSIIKKNLETVDSTYSVESYNWVYPVGDKIVETQETNGRDFVWTPHQLAKKFNQDFFLGPDAKIKELTSRDKISIVTQSMGAMLAMTWYYDSIFNFAETNLAPYSTAVHALLLKRLEKVENFIGFNGEYWGTYDAELVHSFLSEARISEINKKFPLLDNFCQSEKVKKILDDKVISSKSSSWFSGFFKKNEEQLSQQQNEKLVKETILNTCHTVNSLKSANLMVNDAQIPDEMMNDLKRKLASVMKIHPKELENMSLMSDAVNNLRNNRIKHVLNDEYKNRFKVKWTSVIGLLPCFGKSDKGASCNEFISSEYEKLNQEFVALYTGLYRTEMSSSSLAANATADFIFYKEAAGRENTSIKDTKFISTVNLQKDSNVKNTNVYIEDFNSDLNPVLRATSEIIRSTSNNEPELGKAFTDSLLRSSNLSHEKFKRLGEYNNLKAEMGSFVIMLNIHLPHELELSDKIKQNMLKYFRFNYVNYGTGVWGENRTDSADMPYALQIARENQLITSLVKVQSTAESQTLRVFLLGRAWAKSGKAELAQNKLKNGVPVSFSIRIPGVQSRRVTAVVRPAYSTYIDMYMK